MKPDANGRTFDVRPFSFIEVERQGLTVRQAIVRGGLMVAVLDILDAIVFFGLRGVAPSRILQSIASGVLGREAFQGGAATAVLGLGIHLFIAFVIVAIYVLASRRVAALRRDPFLNGPFYGLVVYVVMNWIVVPLSAAGAGARPTAVLINGILIHIFGVGIPAALAARAVSEPQSADRGR